MNRRQRLSQSAGFFLPADGAAQTATGSAGIVVRHFGSQRG